MPFLILIISFSIFFLTRLGLLIYTGAELVPLTLWPHIFIKGFWFDLLIATIFLSIFFLYDAAIPNDWRSKPGFRRVTFIGLWILVSLLLFGAITEVTFWIEFSTRLNFIAVDYLIYTHEVIGNIRQSYPLHWIFLLIALASSIIVWAVRAKVQLSETLPLSRRFIRAGSGILLPVLAAWIGNIEQMEGLGNAYAEELSGNGYFTFAAALRRNDINYDRFYYTIPQKEADDILKTLDVKRTPLSAIVEVDMFDEATDPIPFKKRPQNVILISVESLSASFLGAYGSTRGLTPNLDQLASDGLIFRRAFATGTRTVRGLEALSLGLPPIPGQSVVRRPNHGHLSTIGEILMKQGVSVLFMYGGYGYFDNMNAYFSSNEYQIVDRRHFPKESVVFENIWGVADEVLYSNAIKTLNSLPAQTPFFAHIMTTSNHRPFTYPDGRIDIPSPGGREGAVKYSDYAIGQFIQEAQRQRWFPDTLFVITADHCSSAAGKTKLPLSKYLIPMIFYAPHIVQPSEYAPIVSQIDLLPTLIEILRRKGDDHFFGRSIYEETPPPNRAFVSNYEKLGYLRGDLLTVLLPKKKVECYRVDLKTFEQSPAPIDPDRLREAVAYYQTAARAFKSGALKVLH